MLAPPGGASIVPADMLAAPLMPLAEPGWVTLIKIVGMMVIVMSIIPMILIFSPGSSREEPPDEPEEH